MGITQVNPATQRKSHGIARQGRPAACAYDAPLVVWTGGFNDLRGSVPEKEKKDIEARLKRIGDLLTERKKDDYESLRDRLQEARAEFHDLLADRFAEVFNSHLAAQPHETIAEKQALCRAANADLREVGLSIRCPKTGEPAHLHASPDSSEGRFQICLASDSNYKRTLTSKPLPVLSLMGRPIRGPGRSELNSWTTRTGGAQGFRTGDGRER